MAKAAKGVTYAKALDEARMRGDWDAADQASGTGKSIPWSELIRKYAKHNPNESSTAAVVALEQQIRSSLAHFYKQAEFNDASHLGDMAAAGGKGSTIAPPPLPLNKSGDGWSGESFATAVRELNEARKAAGSSPARLSLAALQAYAYYAIGQDENAVELLHEVRFLEDVDVQAIKGGSLPGEGNEYTVALYMLGFTVYGLANERLMSNRGDEGYIPFALAGYTSAIDIHEGFRGGQSAKALRGLPADEVERWAEVALYYNALFSVRYATPTVALNALRAYQANAGRWPSTFRNPQRLVVYRTYLAELNKAVEQKAYILPPKGATATRDDCRSIAYQTSVIAASASRVEIRDFEAERALRTNSGLPSALDSSAPSGLKIASRTASKRRPAPYRTVRPADAFWNNETLTVQKAAADAMARTSQFPHAGKVNKAALDLSDELIKGWRYSGERGGFDADELVDLFYTLARFTFHSQRITRHLFTILVANENYDEARRALKLYIQIVEKAREGDAADAAALVAESKIREKQEEGQEASKEDEEDENQQDGRRIELSQEAKDSAKEIHIDSDSDESYINTLLHGAHVYCRYLDDARGAKDLIDKVDKVTGSPGGKKISSDFFLLAKIKRVTGATLVAYCRAVNVTSQRTIMHNEALTLFKQAVQMDDQSSETFFQLAQLQGEMLETKLAVRSARRAVELEPANVEYWHLLTLLVSAQQDLRGALQVAEEGLAEAEDDNQRGAGAANGVVNGVKGGAAARASLGGDSKSNMRTTLLSMDFPPTQREREESIVQLLITHNALEEVVEGTVAAINAQREIFEYFQTRIAQWEHVPRTMASSTSIGGRGGEGLNGAISNGQQLGSSAQTPTGESTYSTQLRDAGTWHTRFHSLTGLGQSGSSHHLFGHSRHHDNGQPTDSGEIHTTVAKGVAAPPHVRDGADDMDMTTPTYAQVRDKRTQADEAALLSSLWLMAAASFRRNGNLSDCRVAIQEAERVDPAFADVWLQLGLWFEKQPAERGAEHPVGLAIQCMYKALACRPDHIGATVHLARLFVTHPLNPHIKDGAHPIVSSSVHDVASPLPNTSDNFTASPLASELLSQTQSRRISAPSGGNQPSSTTKRKTTEQTMHEAKVGTKSEAEERKRLATLSMAEGLLVSLTQDAGWSSPEAWLYLSKVLQQTNRPERQRECLQYALELERAKPIRAVSAAIRRAC